MAITFPVQAPNQIADAGFINDLAETITAHDATLDDLGLYLNGTGRYIHTAATKATTAAATDVAVVDFTLPNVHIPAGRIVAFVVLGLRAASTAAGDTVMWRLKQDSTSGTVIGHHHQTLPAAGIAYPVALWLPWRSPGATHTFILTAQRAAGTGTITATTAGPTQPAVMYCRDIATDNRFTIT